MTTATASSGYATTGFNTVAVSGNSVTSLALPSGIRPYLDMEES